MADFVEQALTDRIITATDTLETQTARVKDVLDLIEASSTTDGVISVNGQEGVVSLSTDDILEGVSNKYFVDAPSDSLQYARKDGDWVEVVSTGGGGGDVTSVFGRQGIVVATNGDYQSTQVEAPTTATNYTPTTASVQGHLEGIDTALSSTGGGDVTTVFGRQGDILATAGDYDWSEVEAAALATNYNATAYTVQGHLAGVDTKLGQLEASIPTITEVKNIIDGSAPSLNITATPYILNHISLGALKEGYNFVKIGSGMPDVAGWYFLDVRLVYNKYNMVQYAYLQARTLGASGTPTEGEVLSQWDRIVHSTTSKSTPWELTIPVVPEEGGGGGGEPVNPFVTTTAVDADFANSASVAALGAGVYTLMGGANTIPYRFIVATVIHQPALGGLTNIYTVELRLFNWQYKINQHQQTGSVLRRVYYDKKITDWDAQPKLGEQTSAIVSGDFRTRITIESGIASFKIQGGKDTHYLTSSTGSPSGATGQFLIDTTVVTSGTNNDGYYFSAVQLGNAVAVAKTFSRYISPAGVDSGWIQLTGT